MRLARDFCALFVLDRSVMISVTKGIPFPAVNSVDNFFWTKGLIGVESNQSEVEL